MTAHTNIRRITGDDLIALQSRLQGALANFLQAPARDYPLAVLTSELAAYHEAVRAGAIASSPINRANQKRRLATELLDAFEDTLRGDPPDNALDLARRLHALNKEPSA